jgi:hypothetical protein
MGIPTQHKAAVFFLGLDHREIVEATEVAPSRWAVKLRKGALEWSGYLTAPTWPAIPHVRIEDLVKDL